MPQHSTKHDGRPSFQFYPGDWLEDSDLKEVSLAARGLWVYALCVMWGSPERGALRKGNGEGMTALSLANVAGIDSEEAQGCMDEWKAQAVCSVLPDGTIYCRRMYRTWQLHRHRKEAGAKGGAARWGGKKRRNSGPQGAQMPPSDPLNTENKPPDDPLSAVPK